MNGSPRWHRIWMTICRRFICRYCDPRRGTYQDYLALAQQVSADDISSRVRFFGEVEAALITSPDDEFRFHSGVPA